MPFVAIGVEHSTAPLAVRERIALDRKRILTAGGARLHLPADEAVLLSTCNRVELYLFAEEGEDAVTAALHWLSGHDASLHRYVRVWREMDAAEHLFRVAAGLESQVPGEDQILAQVAGSLEAAQSEDAVGANLHALFRAAVACGRRARAGTSLGRVERSLGSEAVQSAETELHGLEGKSALIVGGGEICRLVARELQSRHPAHLWIANRTASVAEDIAAQVGGTPARLQDIRSIIPSVDVVFSGTSAPSAVIGPDDLPVASLASRPQPLLIYDLAIPRDVDLELVESPFVDVRDLDSLLPESEGGLWAEDISAIEAVIAAELHEFQIWSLTRRVAPVIASLRRHVEAVSEVELQRVAPQLSNLSDREKAAVQSLTDRLIDKMFHHLVMRLRLAAQTDSSLVEAAEFFFLHGEGGLFEDAAERRAREGQRQKEPRQP